MQIKVLGAPLELEHSSGRVIQRKFLTPSGMFDPGPGGGAATERPGPGKQAVGTITEFWLVQDNGGDQCFTLNGRLPIDSGQRISLIRAGTGDQSLLVALANHSSRRLSHIGTAAYALRWLGVVKPNTSLSLGIYIVSILLCLTLWAATEYDLFTLMLGATALSVGGHYYFDKRHADRVVQGEKDFKQAIASYAVQLRSLDAASGAEEDDLLPELPPLGGDPAPAPEEAEEQSATEDGKTSGQERPEDA
jgi:hypothetical protein